MPGKNTEETIIRKLVDSWYAALGRGDATALAAAYKDDVLVAGLAPPLWSQGKLAYIDNMTAWFSTFDGPLKGEPENLSIVAGDSVAFVNGFSHIVGTKKGGHVMDLRARLSLCLEKCDGKWQVATEHASVPFDMQSFTPLLHLTT